MAPLRFVPSILLLAVATWTCAPNVKNVMRENAAESADACRAGYHLQCVLAAQSVDKAFYCLDDSDCDDDEVCSLDVSASMIGYHSCLPRNPERRQAVLRERLQLAATLAGAACQPASMVGCDALVSVSVNRAKLGDGIAAATDLARACELDHARSCSALAEFYFDGTGVPKDASRSAELLRRACAIAVRNVGKYEPMFSGGACSLLGTRHYATGKGVERSPETGEKLQILSTYLYIEWIYAATEKAERDADAQAESMRRNIEASDEAIAQERRALEAVQTVLQGLKQGLESLPQPSKPSASLPPPSSGPLASAPPPPKSSVASARPILFRGGCDGVRLHEQCKLRCGIHPQACTPARPGRCAVYACGDVIQAYLDGRRGPNCPGFDQCLGECRVEQDACMKKCPYCAGDKTVVP